MARELIAQIGCFRGKAAIEWQAMAVDRVENDPFRTSASISSCSSETLANPYPCNSLWPIL